MPSYILDPLIHSSSAGYPSAYATPSLSSYPSIPQLSPPSYPQYPVSQSIRGQYSGYVTTIDQSQVPGPYTMDSLNSLGSMAASASVCSASSLGE